MRLDLGIVALGLIAGPAFGQQAGPKPPPPGNYKVAFWYETDRPTTTLKYQVYDLSRGEFDERAVDRWAQDILDHDRAHGAYVRDIRTEGQPGATESDRLKSVIEAEKARWTALNRKMSTPIPTVIPTSTAPMRREPRRPADLARSPGGPGRPTSPGQPGPVSNPPSSPFPYPYRSGPR